MERGGAHKLGVVTSWLAIAAATQADDFYHSLYYSEKLEVLASGVPRETLSQRVGWQ